MLPSSSSCRFPSTAVVLTAMLCSSNAAASVSGRTAPPPRAEAAAQPSRPTTAPAGAKPKAVILPRPHLEPFPAASITILGKKVHGPKGEDLGLLTDIVFSDDGNPVAAIIDFGGFLGVGTRKLAIDWKLLNFTPGDKNGPLQVSLSRVKIQAAPEYKPDAKSPKMVGPPVPPVSASPDVPK